MSSAIGLSARPTVVIAHPGAPLFRAALARRLPDVSVIEAPDRGALDAAIGEADVLLVSGLWRDDLLDRAPRLRLVQSVSSGMERYPAALLEARGVALASARGSNARAVAEHALALTLALLRRLPEAVAGKTGRLWPPAVAAPDARIGEIADSTVLVVGLGEIGDHLAAMLKALGARVIGVRRHPEAGAGAADRVVGFEAIGTVLPQADVVVLTCPLTETTRGLIGRAALAAMKPGAGLVNVARGACVDETALADALAERRIAAAALDVFTTEPLPPDSPFWSLDNLLLTPHRAGETPRAEERIAALLAENINRLQRGEAPVNGA
ncbi:D-2-hydroxyacid dehydrogenase [Prosthecomicrobium pneumaticum]|uniref:Phosphoglycerate dehydrogenase-like enzyme n=1 Tax=Prosthecomicrobium pneumaticum TaxID=81895 RepID=A0A7W9L444_9HYPH|nr:D-2-hydroxyacid dehydrogenase [Prosthecomicrobium pneumaticum]MBB5755184.1 phosphoglycerate dehydrogenase-like enzyme [Prosthecomicrobium pneumaticum]